MFQCLITNIQRALSISQAVQGTGWPVHITDQEPQEMDGEGTVQSVRSTDQPARSTDQPVQATIQGARSTDRPVQATIQRAQATFQQGLARALARIYNNSAKQWVTNDLLRHGRNTSPNFIFSTILIGGPRGTS